MTVATPLAFRPLSALSSHARRRGFTLVEMLVVITIIGVLMGMTLPAVGYVKELGRQTLCRSNLAQIGKALMMYDGDHQSYPYGRFYLSLSMNGQSRQIANKGNMMLQLLPYLDEMVYYDAINFRADNMSVGSVNGVSISRHTIKAFVCPSDPARGECRYYYNQTTTVGVCNYMGSAGPRTVSSNSSCACPEGTQYNTYFTSDSTYGLKSKNGARRVAGVPSGAFLSHNGPVANTTLSSTQKNALHKFRATTDSMVTDGLSCTIFVGECTPDCSMYPALGWTHYSSGSGLFSTLIPINLYTCSDEGEKSTNGCQCRCNANFAMGFKSKHPGGAFFAFGDGSVHFLPESIDYLTYQYLGSIDDGHFARVP